MFFDTRNRFSPPDFEVKKHKFEFYHIDKCDACWGSNPMFSDAGNRFKPSVLLLNHHVTHNQAALILRLKTDFLIDFSSKTINFLSKTINFISRHLIHKI